MVEAGIEQQACLGLRRFHEAEWEGLGERFEGTVGQLTGNDYAEGAAGIMGEVVEGIAEISAEVAEAPIEIIGSIIEHGGQFVQHVAQGNIGEAVGDTLAVAGYVAAGTRLAVVEGSVEVAGEIAEMVGAVGREIGEGTVDVVENWF